MLRALCHILLITPVAADAVAGAWEAFDTRETTDTWALFAYADELSDPPPWAGTGVDSNPYAYSYFLGGQGVWFFADGLTAGGVLVGDYARERISAIDVSVSVDPAEIDLIDAVVLCDGPNGYGFYYSRIYEPADIGVDPDWYALSFPFDELWFYLDGEDFVAFRPGAAFLSGVDEVGVRFFPAAGVTDESFVGIDDFILVPTVDAPALDASALGDQFRLSFTPNPGVSASIETYLPASRSWQAVSGESGLSGPRVFTTPIDRASRLFRVVTAESLTPVPVAR